MTADSDLYGISGEQCGNDEVFKAGDMVVIAKDFGRPIGGKRTKVLDVKSQVNTSGGIAVLVDCYPNYLSINWVKKA